MVDRTFPVAGSRLWNSLPHDITSAPALRFCSRLNFLKKLISVFFPVLSPNYSLLLQWFSSFLTLDHFKKSFALVQSVVICQLWCTRVRHFPGPAFSSPSIWSVIFQPCVFSLCSFLVRHFQVLQIQRLRRLQTRRAHFPVSPWGEFGGHWSLPINSLQLVFFVCVYVCCGMRWWYWKHDATTTINLLFTGFHHDPNIDSITAGSVSWPWDLDLLPSVDTLYFVAMSSIIEYWMSVLLKTPSVWKWMGEYPQQFFIRRNHYLSKFHHRRGKLIVVIPSQTSWLFFSRIFQTIAVVFYISSSLVFFVLFRKLLPLKGLEFLSALKISHIVLTSAIQNTQIAKYVATAENAVIFRFRYNLTLLKYRDILRYRYNAHHYLRHCPTHGL